MLVTVLVLRLVLVLGIVSDPASVLIVGCGVRFGCGVGFGFRFWYGTLTATTVRNDAFG